MIPMLLEAIDNAGAFVAFAVVVATGYGVAVLGLLFLLLAARFAYVAAICYTTRLWRRRALQQRTLIDV